MKKSLFLLLLLLLGGGAYAQQPGYVWYFGDYQGLDFHASPPARRFDGQVRSDFTRDSESAAVASDEQGRLLFYSDGVSVWNRLHQVMANGTGLWGSSTTTQTLIVPRPGHPNLFYLFTNSPQGDYDFYPANQKGFRYSVVDLSLEGGLGAVIEKNVLLHASTTEKVAGAFHANSKHVWVVMHEWNSDVFRAYLITEEGISPSPTFSRAGSVHQGGLNEKDDSNAAGQMKISPNGSKIALATSYAAVLEVYSFDNETGIIRWLNSLQNFSGIHGARLYGVEFSPNSQVLYVTDLFRSVYQFDLRAGDILKSKTVLSDEHFRGLAAQLQLGPDGKIYLCRFGGQYIGVINQPNTPGPACLFQEDALYLGEGNYTYGGLPNFISGYFLPPPPLLEMPNVFTPNGDAYNPQFLPIRLENVVRASLRLCNRWGEVLFQTDDLQRGWDGQAYPAGMYYWQADYEGSNGKAYSQKGYLHLLR